MLLGYARASTQREDLESQIDALTAEGVTPQRIYSDRTERDLNSPRPGWAALLDYARPGDVTVVVGIDRLGRTTPELMDATRELAQREIGLRSLREGVDTADSAGGMLVGVLASLAELEAESRSLRRTRSRVAATRSTGARSASSITGSVGRPRVLDDGQIAVAERMRAAGDPVPQIAAALGVSRATLYRSLAERKANR